jgi:SAM-dependent methyltransferase
MEHTQYHQRIIEVLLAMTYRGWRVLDIGAGNGVLSIPLYVRGCEVTALEPSVGMRNLLYKEAFQKGIDGLNVDERIWEEVPCYEFLDYDLILACNTLHLTQMSFEAALAKVFRAGPAHVLLVSEARPPDVRVKWHYENYTLVFMKSYEVDSSYAYHHLNEMVEHWTFKKGRVLQLEDIPALRERIVLQGGHLWIKDTAQVMMCWWKRDG